MSCFAVTFIVPYTCQYRARYHLKQPHLTDNKNQLPLIHPEPRIATYFHIWHSEIIDIRLILLLLNKDLSHQSAVDNLDQNI